MISRIERWPAGCRQTARPLVLGILLLATAGCSRAFYRHQADREVCQLVDCASRETGSSPEDYRIRPDPRSRMFDPSCPDRPPMPPDDPTAHKLMHCVDCKPGWPCWRCYGETQHAENPDWQAYLPYNEQGEVVMDREEAVQLALLHSREYQQELENLYLSALGVTLQRFRFDTQFFGGNSTFFTADGPERGGGQSLLQTDTDLQMRKLLATGGELVVGMANSLVWQFAGPDSYGANTLLNFELVQPLLRAAGRAVVLESLTNSERALLADIRQMERFRREFYIQIVADGFLGLLEEQVRIRNQERNVAALQDSYERLDAAFQAGQMEGQTRYQVDLARQSLLNGQSQLISLKAGYQDGVDAFKIALGLPPDLDVRVEDPLLERFNLIAPALTATQDAVAALLEKLLDPEQAMPADYRDQVSTIREQCAAHLDVVQRDLHLLEEALPARREDLRRLSARKAIQRGEVDPITSDVEALDERAAELNKEFAKLSDNFKTTLAELEPFQQDPPGAAADAGPDALREGLADLVTRLSDQLLQLSLIQAGARLDTITLAPIELDPDRALEIARQNRRDWMNERAALVDTWRQIELAADDLESDLDVTFSGELDTTDNNPVRFRGTTGQLQVGLEFDAPLTRLEERNTYRRILIAYQEARRTYYAFEDEINQTLRDSIRTIELNQLNFEVLRAGLIVAITRVDLARRELSRPLKPGETSQVGVTAARDLVDALQSLLDSQNSFLNAWVGYETLRLNLDLNLGTMQLDDRGLWIDPGPIKMEESREDGPTRDSQEIPGPEQPEEIPPLPQPEEIPAPAGLALPEAAEAL